jgi:HPt (histidine-containing phosphotransfer) domain-containing protein
VRPELLDEILIRALPPPDTGLTAARAGRPGDGDPAARPPALDADDHVGGSLEPAMTAESQSRDSLETVLDASRLHDAYGDDDDGRAEIVALFRTRARTAIHEITEAIEADEPAAAARLAHGLKGSSAVVGAVALAAVAGELGTLLASAGPGDAAGVRAELERTFQATDAAFTSDPGI